MGHLVSGVVVALILAMFVSGALMISESSGSSGTSSTISMDGGKTCTDKAEPNKMYIGIVYLLISVFLGIYFIYYKTSSNNGGNNY
jgi:hypothetical protein